MNKSKKEFFAQSRAETLRIPMKCRWSHSDFGTTLSPRLPEYLASARNRHSTPSLERPIATPPETSKASMRWSWRICSWNRPVSGRFWIDLEIGKTTDSDSNATTGYSEFMSGVHVYWAWTTRKSSISKACISPATRRRLPGDSGSKVSSRNCPWRSKFAGMKLS